MRIISSAKYQISRQKRGVIGYYAAWVGIILFITVVHLLFREGGDGVLEVNGASFPTAGFMFAVCVAAFRENLRMSLQNGVSRRSMFLGHLAAVSVLALILSLLDACVTLLVRLVGLTPRMNVTAGMLGSLLYPELAARGAAVELLLGIVFGFFLLLPFGALGDLISAIYYRLNTPGKVVFSVAGGALLVIGLPLLVEESVKFPWLQAVLRAVWQFLTFAFSTPWLCMASCFVLFALFSAISWILLRRAYLK